MRTVYGTLTREETFARQLRLLPEVPMRTFLKVQARVDEVPCELREL